MFSPWKLVFAKKKKTTRDLFAFFNCIFWIKHPEIFSVNLLKASCKDAQVFQSKIASKEFTSMLKARKNE